MDVTVAICTWNRARLLEQTLERMTALRPPAGFSWELFVVDNNSSDDTREVTDRFRARLPLTYLREPAQGLSNARNLALDASQARYLLYTDDDVLVDADWLAAFARGAARHPAAAAFGGPIEPWFPTDPDPALVEAFPLLGRGFCGIHGDRPEGPLRPDREVFGANMGFSRAATGSLRFDPALGASSTVGREGEEVAFSAQLRDRGRAIVWLPDMRVKHYVDPSRMTLHYLAAYYEGRGRTDIRREGLPPTRAIFGAQPWLVRRWLGRAAIRAGRGVLGSRAQYLAAVRDERFARGRLKESLTLHGERTHAGRAPTGASASPSSPR